MLDTVEVCNTTGKSDVVSTYTNEIDRGLYLYRDRARRAAAMACTAKEPKPGNDQMGLAQRCGMGIPLMG